MKAKGFTLIELMIVVLIVAILAAVAVPLMRGRVDSSKWSEGKAAMGTISTAIRAYAAEKGANGTKPTTLAELGFVDGDLDGTYFTDECYSISVTTLSPLDYEITCDSGSGTSEAPSNPVTMTLDETGTFTPGDGGTVVE